MRAEKAEEEVAELVKKSQQLETELDITHERLSIVIMQLEEKEKALMAAEAEVHTVRFINKDGRNSHINNLCSKLRVSNFD